MSLYVHGHVYTIVHNYRLCSLADNHSVRAAKLARPSTVFTTYKVHYCMLLREISRTTFNALVEWLLGQPLNVRSTQGQPWHCDNSKLRRASEHDLSTVPSDGVKLSTDMWSLYTVVFLAALLPGKSC